MHSMHRDYAAELSALNSGAAVALTAGGSGDNVAAPGASIDLMALTDRFEWLGCAIVATASLAATRTLTVVGKLETSADGSTWEDLPLSSGTLTLTGATGGSSEAGGVVIGASLEYAKRFVRSNVTPDLSATSTDTATVQRTVLLAGKRRTS